MAADSKQSGLRRLRTKIQGVATGRLDRSRLGTSGGRLTALLARSGCVFEAFGDPEFDDGLTGDAKATGLLTQQAE